MSNTNKLSQIIGPYLLTIVLLTITACGQELSEQQILNKAKAYLDEDSPKSAAIELRNVLQKNGNNAEARFLLGNINLDIGDFASAEKEFEKALLAGGDQQLIQVALANIFITTGKYQKLLDEITNQNTWSAETHANITALRALAEAGLDKPKLAQASLEEAKSYKADAFHVLKTTSIFQLAKLKKGDAEKTLAHALSLYPDNTELLFLLASYEIQNMNLSAASDAYTKIIHNKSPNLITPYTIRARIGLTRIQVIENKLDAATLTLAPVLKTNKNHPEANYLNGLINFKQKDYAHAEIYIRKLLSVFPEHNQSHKLMGGIKYALKEFEQASHHLSTYLKTTPGDTNVRIMLTQAYIALKQTKQALSTLQPLLADDAHSTITSYLLSQIAFIDGDLDKGIKTLKDAIKSSPNNAKLHAQLIKAYINANENTLALKSLKKYQTLSNDSEESQKLAINVYLKTGNIDDALKIAEKMLAKKPRDPATLSLNGNLHAEKNDFQLARKYFNEALQLQSNLPSATIGLASLERREGNLDKAIALYKRVVESGTADATPMLALSELAAQQKRTSDMLSWLEKARIAAPDDINSRRILSNYYLQNSQPGQATIYLQEALKTSPEHPELLILQSRMLMAKNQYKEALSPLKKLIEKYPNSINSQLLIGETFLQLNKLDEARKHLLNSLKTQPDNLFATILIAETEFKSGNLNRSLSYAKKIQHIQPELFSGYALEGNVWMARKNYNRATQSYKQAWKYKQTADLAQKLFISSRNTTTLKEAIKPLLSWLTQHPEDSPTRVFLASIYQNENQVKDAIREYKIILENNPDHSFALNNLAWSYSQTGNPKALDMAERAYRLAPENAGIQDTYGWILTQQGQAEKGLRLLKQAIETLPRNPDVRFHFALALIKTGDNTQGMQILKELVNQPNPFDDREQAERLLRNPSQ